jgi:phosphopantothenoylcysteine decarboxylase/phosphopantothenate--cysteine ligase
MTRGKNIILGVSASIAVYKACEILRRLRKEAFNVRVIETPEAARLISPIVFQSLSANQVYSELFGLTQDWRVEHIGLAQEADLILIAPATANIIAKIASGICDDLLTCVVSATKAKVMICPAMNAGMYRNKITQENIRKLKSLGYRFIGPKVGELACGESGIGCLAEIEEIVKEVKKILQ